MIRLAKGPEPAVLRRNAGTWTAELVQCVEKGETPTKGMLDRYRNDEIKEALRKETHEKCAYCESKPLHVTYGDIEHITPKDQDPQLRYAWANLTLACDVCNTNKGKQGGLIDPYKDDPEREFAFLGPMLIALPDGNGERTVDVLKLNRIQLIERRKERIENLMTQVYRLNETHDRERRAFLRAKIIEHETKSDREYAACARAIIANLSERAFLPGAKP